MENDNLIFLGIALAVYEAMILICYFFLSVPILSLLNGIITLCTGISQMATYGTPTLVIFNIIFAIAFIVPIVWFFVKIAQVESGYNVRRL